MGEVNKKQLADIFWREYPYYSELAGSRGMPVLRGGGKGNEGALLDSTDVIKWYAERDAESENSTPGG
ncbi:terminase small subunit [Escherichia coli]|uniref:terminase small subunit n=1 Tax=Escherichia coli TaxID=562 RepID=UPI00388E4A9E